MSKIYDFTLSYGLFKSYVMFAFKRFFSRYIVMGKENIPETGPIILAPNHLNALMDALAAISVVPHKMPVVFLARSDYFNNKLIARFLHFCKILPAFRMREGLENVDKNNDVFEVCVDVLNHNQAIGIMPEGNQGSKRKLRPLAKGIYCMAIK
jgi:1-acyl-sn-glycerol-3-phosphate acyltransferase